MGGEKEGEIDPLRLSSCHIIEVLADDTLLWSWSYPYLSPQLRTICSSKCKIILSKNQQRSVQQQEDDGKQIHGTSFHLDKSWFYVVFPGVRQSIEKKGLGGGEENNESEVKMVGVLVVAEDFCPEMYQRVGNVLYLTFLKTGDPSIVLQQFLSLMVDGTCLLPKKKTFILADHSLSSNYDKHQIKEIILRFGLETILIYTALQRKKKVVVYHYDIDVLSDFTLSLPILCGDYSNEIWNSIYPWVDLNDDELELIKNIPFYVMGCTAAGVETCLDLFDVFVNIPAAEISVAPHARESIAMNKTHKDLATFMVQLAASNDNTSAEEELVAGIMKRTADMNNMS